MKRSLLKGLILGTIFVFSIILFSNILNKDVSEETGKMGEPTLPVLYMELADMPVNPMYGYYGEMQPQYYRESITPLTTKRELSVTVNTYGNDIKSISYKVMSADGSETVENGKIGKLTREDSYVTADFKLENRILMNQEYLLCFQVDCGKEELVSYYTRIVQRAGLNVSQYLQFVRDFYEKCFNKETARDLTRYLEPDETVTNSSFTKINIHSSFDQLTWGTLAPKLWRKAVPTIREINETTCTIVQTYEMTAKDAEDNTEYYNVEEYYRMRYSQSRVMLLDFERSAQEIFDGSLPVLTKQGINLGIVDSQIQYMSNQNADIIAFVQEGELWSYNRSANKAAHVFGFRGTEHAENADERKSNSQHDIKIIRVEESGDLDFVVYGYMNCGDHEGYTGVSVYHYSAERNVSEEQVFIPSTMSYDFLKDDVEKLSYVNQDDQLYLLLENSLFHVDIQGKTYDTILEDISPDCMVVSKSQASVAWMDQMQEYASSSLTVMDLNSGEQRVEEAGNGQKIRALGFINEDLIYGLARDEDIVTDAAGNTTFAMHNVRIQNFEGEIVKEYQQDGIWVSAAVFQEGLVELKRVQWQENAYVPVASENIMNNLQTSEETVSIHLSVSSRKGTQVALDFSKSAKSKAMLVVETEYVIPKSSTVMELEIPKANQQLYYIYAKGAFYGAETKSNLAIMTANDQAGVVLNGDQQYVWERGNRKDKIQIAAEEIPESVLSGTLDEHALADALGGDFTALNMTGCTLESVLYQVSEGRAVVALTPTGESVVIIGYDIYNTILYNPATQETYYYGMNDSTSLFESAGNVFLGYMETLEARTGK